MKIKFNNDYAGKALCEVGNCVERADRVTIFEQELTDPIGRLPLTMRSRLCADCFGRVRDQLTAIEAATR